MGEPARAAILVALVNGRALPGGELAFIGNVAPQTASFHLRKLTDASLIGVEKQGKHSYYRLANERGAATLECSMDLEFQVVDGEYRYTSVGHTRQMRILFVAWTLRGEAIRPITAYDAPSASAENYLAHRGP